jgi:hypothetical protein
VIATYKFLADATLAALLASISPFSNMVQHMGNAVGHDVPSSTIDRVRIKFIISNISRYPLEALKRQAREHILNIAYLLHINGLSSLVLPLVEKLWRKGNATAYMTTCATAFVTYFQGSSVTRPARQLLQHTVFNKDQNQVQKYLRDLIEIAGNYINEQPAMCTVVVTELWRLRTEENINRNEALQSLRVQLMQMLHSRILSSKHVRSFQEADLWRQLWELQRDNRDDALRLIAKLSRDIIRHPADKLEHPIEMLNLLCAVSETLEDISKTTAFILHASGSLLVENRNQVLLFYRAMVQRLDVEPQVEFTLWLTKGCANLTNSSPWSWMLLQEAISSFKSTSCVFAIVNAYS